MLKVYGSAVSNYQNMVELALLEKGVAYETVDVNPQDEAFKQLSPAGKMPCLVTEQGPLTETMVILEYLEQTQSGKALLPSEPYARAQVKALIAETFLYIEWAARPCYAAAFMGGTVEPAILAKAKADFAVGVAALKRHGRFAPYLAGADFSLADIAFFYSMELAVPVANKCFGQDVLEQWPEAAALLAKIAENPHVKDIAARKKAAMAAFLARIAAAKKA